MVWPPQINHGMSPMPRLIAVAIDRDKGSQISLKWTVEHLVSKGQTLILIHVKAKQSSPFFATSASLPLPRPNQISDMDDNGSTNGESDAQTRELFLPFHIYCARKDISCYDVVLEDTDVTKAITEFVKQSGIDVLVLGATAKGNIFRFKAKDIPGSVLKGVPDFCNIYIIQWKGKISSMRAASRPPPSILSPLRAQIMLHVCSHSDASQPSLFSSNNSKSSFSGQSKPGSEPSPNAMQNEAHFMKSPFTHRMGPNGKPYDLSPQDTDISFVSSGRKSIDIISGRKSIVMFPSYHESFESGHTSSQLSGLLDIENHAFESWQLGRKSVGTIPLEFSYASLENDRTSTSQSMEEIEAEMRRLKVELKQTMDMYSTACKEALSAKQKAKELQHWKMEEQRRLEEARLAEEAALALVEKEKAKSRAALEHAEAAQRIAELEAQKRINAEMKALKEAEEKTKVLNALANSDVRYRKYSIEEIEVATNYFSQAHKIGEGGYGPVYKCYLDHTPVAVKVLRPDATQGRSQFQQEACQCNKNTFTKHGYT